MGRGSPIPRIRLLTVPLDTAKQLRRTAKALEDSGSPSAKLATGSPLIFMVNQRQHVGKTLRANLKSDHDEESHAPASLATSSASRSRYSSSSSFAGRHSSHCLLRR